MSAFDTILNVEDLEKGNINKKFKKDLFDDDGECIPTESAHMDF